MSDPSIILICELCEKLFTEDIAYKRHVNYCRKRKHQQRVRKRPCRACKVAKVKCIEGVQCQRCQQKGLVCSYENQYPEVTPKQPHATNGLPSHDQEHADYPENAAVDDLTSFMTTDQVAAGLFDFSNQNNEAVFTQQADFFDDSLIPLPNQSSFTKNYHLQIEPNQDWTSIFHLDPYTSALLPNEVDKWVLRPTSMPDPLAENHARRLIRMLVSIPRMMVRRENFPPFIHSHWQHELPGPLANCMTIARLFCTRDTSNSALVWNTIRLEQERLAKQTYDFSKEELMAGLQAYLVYMIMRAQDDTSQTAGDVPMLVTLKALTDWCYHLFGGYPPRAETQYDPRMNWETWRFRESQRRCALLYFLIGRVFNVFTGEICPCTADPLKLPLPAPRSVWEARTETDWLTAYQDLFQRDRLRTFGDLMQEMQLPTWKLDEWHCGIDYLGSLLESATGTFHA